MSRPAPNRSANPGPVFGDAVGFEGTDGGRDLLDLGDFGEGTAGPAGDEKVARSRSTMSYRASESFPQLSHRVQPPASVDFFSRFSFGGKGGAGGGEGLPSRSGWSSLGSIYVGHSRWHLSLTLTLSLTLSLTLISKLILTFHFGVFSFVLTLTLTMVLTRTFHVDSYVDIYTDICFDIGKDSCVEHAAQYYSITVLQDYGRVLFYCTVLENTRRLEVM